MKDLLSDVFVSVDNNKESNKDLEIETIGNIEIDETGYDASNEASVSDNTIEKDNEILEEQLLNLEKDILVLKNKVENEEFLKKAPPVVVEKFTKKMKQKLSLKNKILTQIKS